MRKLVSPFLILLLCSCQPQSQAESAGVVADSYVLALSWQPAFCETAPRKPECRAQTPASPDARRFSLHGLWPQPGSRVWCGNDSASIAADKQGRWRDIAIDRLDEPLWHALQAAMPGTRSNLHRHEWIKHGTCMAGADAATYFDASLDLVEIVNQSQFAGLFADRLGRHLSAGEIRTAFEADFGKGAGARIRIACVDVGSRRLISEVTLGLKGKLPPQGLSREAFSEMVMASPATDPGCPGGLVDGAGNQ